MIPHRHLILCLAALTWLPLSCREAGQTPPQSPGPALKPPPADGDEAFLGLSEEAGTALAKQRQLRSRVISVDGEPRPATRDYRPDRVNFEIEQGRIVRTSRG